MPPRMTRRGQGAIEFLLLLGVILAGLVGLANGPLKGAVQSVFGQSVEQVDLASAHLSSRLVPWADQREQEQPGAEDEEEPEGDEPIVLAGGPGISAPPTSTPSSPDVDWPSGGGGGGGGGSTGSSGGSSGGSGGTVAGPRPPSAPLAPPVTTTPPTGLNLAEPTAGELDLITSAANLLLTAAVPFELFDFSHNATVSYTSADIINNLSLFGADILSGDLLFTDGALAEVRFSTADDGTVVPAAGVFLIFDRTVLANFSTEMVASVFAHEGWHVTQVYTGIIDDRTNYPRVVDIEYEAFVAGGAVWNAVKGGQTEPSLDAGAACVAQGEARCKEILATDFGYPTGLRQAALPHGTVDVF